ncbi:MAG: ATP-binding cassette domain-containing protein, partial [Bacilli bacterium]
MSVEKFQIEEDINEKIVEKKSNKTIFDDHEDVIGKKVNLVGNQDINEFNKKYGVNPRVKQKPKLRKQNILLSVRHLKQFFSFGSGLNKTKLKAVSNVCFDLKEGECLGIVGESGCGKTTTGRSIIKLYDITSGSIYYRGVRISGGIRWNQKEIKWTRVRANQKCKELNVKRKEELEKLDSSNANYEKEKKDINSKYDYEIANIRENANNVYIEQHNKIKQIKFDNNHVSRKLLNEIQM